MSYSVLPDGFIRHYLYTGRKESEFSCDVQETNQLRSEKKMRELAARHDPLTPPADLRLGGESHLGLPWKYYYSHGNIFLDDPAFYEELCRVEMHTATGLELAAPARISLRLWSYAAVDLWVDGAPACTLEHPVYKPIQYRDFTLDLSAGQHLLYLRLENLGVRDTRIAFAVQITQGADLVRVTLPDADHCAPYEAAAALLDSARVQGGRLTLRAPLPADLEEIAAGTGAFHYTTSNARIDGYKTGDYLLTSVQSPRRDGVQRVWQPEEREEMRDHFIYVKSLNEHFHGTTQFQPGEYGYQQHMWYAALSDDLVVFANHPGHTCEDMSEVRPGYWYGNGSMPALRQQDNVLGAVYVIPQSNPIAFTHLFWQQDRFDETAARGGWIFGRRGNSCIGVWCSVPLVDHDETMFGCEKRAMAPACAYLVVCGSTAESGSFDAFCQSCLDRPVAFDSHTATLHCAEFDLPFTAGSNGTQILD